MNSAERRRQRRIDQQRLERQALLQRTPPGTTKQQMLSTVGPPAVKTFPLKVDFSVDMTKWHEYIAKQMAATSFSFGPLVFSDSAPSPPSVDPTRLAVLKDATPYKVICRTPDYVQVITAWRAWAVVYANDGWRLKALGVDHVWEPKKQLDARCTKNSGGLTFRLGSFGQAEKVEQHPAPQMDCTCGVWAFKELDSLVAAIGSSYGQIRVLGQVSLWGRVVETVNGYRAQHAYPSELWLLDNSLEELGLIYDVPVRMIS